MASSTSEVIHEIPGFFQLYKDGRFERLGGNDVVPAMTHPETGVQSKDVVILPETGVAARLYLPKTADPHRKLPLLVYFHGGAFVVETPFSPLYHTYVNALVAAANVVAVSVHYRRAPEHPLPAAYDDSWAALKWVASHSNNGLGDEAWLRERVDFDRVFLAGDSAGANIAHNMGIRVGSEELQGMTRIAGIVLVHPYFFGEEPIGGEVNLKKPLETLWLFTHPSSSGCDDPLLNPVMHPNLSRLGCNRVVVFVGEKDAFRDRGWYYYEELGKSGWGGEREIVEHRGEGHVFHLFNSCCENALDMLKRLVSFINHDHHDHA